MNRIAGMDGLRGIACLMVMLCHLSISGMQPFGYFLPIWGEAGVSIFFALSAFLLGGQLLRGEIRLPDYAKRRAFRILPIYWALIAVSAAVGGGVLLHHDYVAHALLLKGNGHLWTIPVECMWYAVEPAAVIVAVWMGRRWYWLPLVAIAAACIAAPDVPSWTETQIRPTLLHAYPGFLAGLAAAYLRDRWKPQPTVIMAAVLAMAALLTGQNMPFQRFVVWGGMSMVLILGIVGSRDLGAMLDAVPLRFLGRVSFSAYLLHPWIFGWFDGVVVLGFPHHMTAVATIAGACAIATTLAISHFTYQYFERPILQWVRRPRVAVQAVPVEVQ